MTSLHPSIRRAPALQLVSLTRRVAVKDLEAFYAEARGRLLQFIEQQGGQSSGPLMGIFHAQVTTDSDGPVEIGLTYTGVLVPEGEFAPSGPLFWRAGGSGPKSIMAWYRGGLYLQATNGQFIPVLKFTGSSASLTPSHFALPVVLICKKG
ncbi:hypothetical protein [Deinococcus alpinitundrae]|uniref:hypothetical protein n=1 Tax=Deinococcus alpinitundrae TaxID=468913 RepID=UPI001379656E|nr:hypothetical protein [Deinococcus alpinitundrae]